MTSAEDEYRFVPGGEQHNEDSPLYKTDEFRMFCFKVLPCSKRYCHDWTTCPFAHPGEKAKRRDPRVHTYTGVACPDMKKNLQCLRADSCPYAHNVFEYYLHPSRYRTQLCNDGVACRRKVCFFAHTLDELRVSSVKVLPAELGGRLPAPEADPFRNSGQSNSAGKYDRDRRMSTPAAPRSGSSDMRGGLGLSAGPQHSSMVSPVSPLTSNLFDSVGSATANGSAPLVPRCSNVRHSATNGHTSTSPVPASQSCGQVHFGGGSNSGKGFNAPKVPSLQQQQQEWFDSGAASALVPELQALLRGHQQHSSSNGGAPAMAPSTSPGMDLIQMAQMQQLAAAQAQIQAIHAQQHQQALMEQLAASLTQLQLSGALPQHSLNDVVGLLMQQMTAAAAASSSTTPSSSQQMLGNLNAQQGTAASSAAAQLFASNSGMMMASASQSGAQAQQQMSQSQQQQQWSNQGGPMQHPSNGGMQQQPLRTYPDHAIGDLRQYLSSSAVGHLGVDNSMQGNQHSYSNGPAMTGMGGADARYANFMQGNVSAPSVQQQHSVLRSQTNPLPVVDGPLHQQMLARYSFNNSPPSLLDGQGPISHRELLELANCSNTSNSHEYGSMGDVLCPLRPFPQAQGYSRSGQSSSGQASDAQISGKGLDLGFANSGPLLSGSSDTTSADTHHPSGSLSPTTYALMFPPRTGSQGSGDLDQGFQVSSDLSSMDPALFSRANYGRAPQVGGPKRATQQLGVYHHPGYNPAITASNPGVQHGNNGNNGIVFYRSSVESRSDMSERCSLEIATGGGDMGGHGVRSMSSEDSYRYSVGQPAPVDGFSALTAAHQRRSMNPDASVNPWATAAAIKVGVKAQRGSTGTDFPGHSKFMFANANIDEQQGSLDGPIESDSDEVFGLRKGLDALVGSLRL